MSLTGTLRLKAVRHGLKTVVADTYFDGAFKVARPIYFNEHEPVIYTLHVGGGYVGGDRYHTEVALDPDAHMTMTTQSAAKVYKTPAAPVYQSMAIRLAAGSVFAYLPDPLIAYEQARFFQETTIHMEKGAVLFYSDIITPGWSPSGELFRYEWIRSKLKIYEEGVLQTYDHLFLQPDEQSLVSLMQMEGYTHTGSLFLIAPFMNELQDELDQLLAPYEVSMRIGCSRLKLSGCSIRLLAHSTHEIEKVVAACQEWMRKKLDQEPLKLRKY